MNSNNWLAKLPKMILAFIAALALVVTGALFALRMTIYSQEFMIHQTEKSEYAKDTAKDINEHIQDYGRGSNLPPEVLGEVVTPANVQDNLDTFIRAIYTDLPFSLTGENEIRQNLNTKINAYAKEKSLVIDQETQKNIDDFITNSIKVFTDYVSIASIRHYAKQVMNYESQLMILITLSTIFTGLLFIGLWLISGRFNHQKVRMIAYPIGGAGLMLVVLPVATLMSGIIRRVAIQSKAIYQFVTTYLESTVMTVILIGGFFIVVSIVLLLLSEIMRRKLRRRV